MAVRSCSRRRPLARMDAGRSHMPRWRRTVMRGHAATCMQRGRRAPHLHPCGALRGDRVHEAGLLFGAYVIRQQVQIAQIMRRRAAHAEALEVARCWRRRGRRGGDRRRTRRWWGARRSWGRAGCFAPLCVPRHANWLPSAGGTVCSGPAWCIRPCLERCGRSGGLAVRHGNSGRVLRRATDAFWPVQ